VNLRSREHDSGVATTLGFPRIICNNIVAATTAE
jgi:hypothetical protein